MLRPFFAAVALLLAAALGLASGSLDTAFQQDVSFRSIFSDKLDAATDPPLPKVAWEHLPFKSITSKYQVVTLPELGCVLVLSEGKLYSSKRSASQSEDDKLNLVNPWAAWQQIGDAVPDGLMLKGAQSSTIYVVTGDNVAQLSLSDACDSASIVQDKLLSESAPFGGKLQALTLGPAKSSTLFVCSLDAGLFSVSLSAGTAELVPELGSSCAAALYVEAHAALYAANSLALYTLALPSAAAASTGTIPSSTAHHEWIGGVIDLTPLDLVYDSAGNYVWLAEPEAVHRLEASSGAWMRFGYQQNAPFRNVSSVAVSSGSVWVGGSDNGGGGGGVGRFDNTASPVQLDGLLVPAVEPGEVLQSDPWTWSYYGGHRYLPSNRVIGLQPYAPAAAGGEQSVLVITTIGLAWLIRTPWTLRQKAEAELRFQPRHDRSGLSSGVVLSSPGDLSSAKLAVDDNDGLWTSMHAMGMAYWALAEPDNSEARDRTWSAFTGLEKLFILPGAYPRYPARTFCKVGDGAVIAQALKTGKTGDALGCGSDLSDPVWHPAAVTLNGSDAGEYFYKGDTSSDELCGHMAAYPLIFDALASSSEQQQQQQQQQQQRRVLAVFEGTLLGILENDYTLMDPATGLPTTWGFWAPEQLNQNPEHYSERGPNSLQMLAWLTAAYSLTGKELYSEAFWTLARRFDYVRNAMNVKLDSVTDENHSDTELIFLAYHSLFYSLRRLETAKGKGEGDRRERVEEMCSLLLPSLRRTWLLAKGEMSPLWLAIYAGTAQQKVTQQEMHSAEWTLRRWAMDNVDWQISGLGRIDLVLSPFLVRLGVSPIFKNTRPPAEQAASHANNDPFELISGGAGNNEVEPAVFLTPLRMMAFYGLLRL